MDSLFLSLIIPVFNEERRLYKTFSALEDFFQENTFKRLEVIFADDGSTDGTAQAVQSFGRKHPEVRLVSYPSNKGKGFAVRRGMLEAQGAYRLMCDADMSTPLGEFKKFLVPMEQDYSVIIGTRKAAGASIRKPQVWHRRKLGEGYTWLANIVTGLRVSDFTCGFKCFSGEAADRIFRAARISRWSYDAEILYLAHKNGFAACEVPVTWMNDEDSRVRLASDVWRSFIDLIRIRTLHH